MKAALIEREMVGKNIYECTFRLSSGELNFKPGQYVTVKLSQKSEDYLGNERIFSLVNPPSENKIAKILFRFRESWFKKNLLKSPIGTPVEIDKPQGVFDFPKEPNVNLIFLAGGVGIAPFMSCLKYFEQNPLGNPMVLFYSIHDKSSGAYLKEIRNLKIEKLRVVLIETLGQKKKRINISKIRKHTEVENDYFFLSGSPEFVQDLVWQLVENGVDKKRITQESFDGY